MRFILSLVTIIFLSLFTMGAKPHINSTFVITNNEIKFLELKLKKELNDKKLTPQKKYTLAILAARELKQLYYSEKALEFYQVARDIKIDENKNEINQVFSNHTTPSKLFYFDVSLKSLIINKNYEKAILSLNPERLSFPENYHYRIVYDLLNVKIKKRSVKKLYCFEDYQKNPDDYQYSNLLCDLLVDYLNDGKLGNDHIKVVEEYFLKHDMKETYLIQIAKDLKNN